MTEQPAETVEQKAESSAQESQKTAQITVPNERPAVRIVGRGNSVVVQISESASSWKQIVDMLRVHLSQANGFFRGEGIVLELGGYVVDDDDLDRLLSLLREQEMSLRMLRTSEQTVHDLAKELGLAVTLHLQPHVETTPDQASFGHGTPMGADENWEVILGERDDEVGSTSERDASGAPLESGGAMGAVVDADESPRRSSEATTGKNRHPGASGAQTREDVVSTDRDRAPGSAVQSSFITSKVDPALLQRISAPPFLYRGTLRSGQVFRHAGPVVIIGDVNPGAEIISGGDIYVWGRLRGVVHAGAMGDERAVVGALEFEPLQLRIAGEIAMSPKGEPDDPARWFWKRNASGRPEMARIVNGRIIVDQWDDSRWFSSSRDTDGTRI